MHKKFEINPTKIKGGCQSRRKVVTHDSMSDFPLARRRLLLCPRLEKGVPRKAINKITLVQEEKAFFRRSRTTI